MHRTHSFAALSPVTFLERSGRAFPKKQAIISPDRSVDFSTLLSRARRLADGLRTLGVQPDEKIAVLAENSVSVVEIHFGVPATGAVLVMLNPWISAADIRDMLDFSDATVLIVDSAFIEKAREIKDMAPPALRHILVISEKDDIEVGLDSYSDLVERASDLIPLDHYISDETAPMTINFTSGTTGRPKGVMSSHRAIYLNAIGQGYMLGLARSSHYLWTLPMFHVNGWCHIWTNVAVGATQIVLPGTEIRGKEANLIDLIPTYGITHLCGAPRLVRALAEIAGESQQLSGVTITTGGAAPSPMLITQLEAMGVNFVHQYGLNETLGPFVVCEEQDHWQALSPEQRAQKRCRQGLASLHAGTGLRVVDDNGNDVPADGRTLGEVVMSGNTVAIGYYKNPEATQKSFINGWFHSGDMAVVYPDGYLEIRDRIKDLIYIETDYGWENISSGEVENALCRFAGIRDAAVVGVALAEDGENAGQSLIAFLEKAAQTEINLSDLDAWIVQVLPPHKRPEFIFFSTLPKTATGKVRKDLLVADARNRVKVSSVSSQI